MRLGLGMHLACTHAWVWARMHAPQHALLGTHSKAHSLPGALSFHNDGLCYHRHVHVTQQGARVCATHHLSACLMMDALIHGAPIWMCVHNLAFLPLLFGLGYLYSLYNISYKACTPICTIGACALEAHSCWR